MFERVTEFLRSLVSWAGMVLVSFSLTPLIAICAPINRRLSRKLARLMAKGILASDGVEFEVINNSGRDDLPCGAVYVANHQSYLDICALIAGIECDFRFLAKKTLLFLPAINIILLAQKHILIDLKNVSPALRVLLKKGPEYIRGGANLFIFPEGGRNPDGRPGEFREGAAAVAIRAQAPIVPVAIVGAQNAMPKSNWPIKPGKIKIVIGKPIETAGMAMSKRKELTVQIKNWIVETIDFYSQADR